MGSLYVASGAIMFLTKGASSFDDVKNKQTALYTLPAVNEPGIQYTNQSTIIFKYI